MSTEGSLLGRNDSWIQSVPKYPVLNKSQSQIIKEPLPKLVGEAMSLKTSHYQAYVNLTQKIATTDIPANKKTLILLVQAESNKGATTQELVLSWRSILSLASHTRVTCHDPFTTLSYGSKTGFTWPHMARHGHTGLHLPTKSTEFVRR